MEIQTRQIRQQSNRVSAKRPTSSPPGDVQDSFVSDASSKLGDFYDRAKDMAKRALKGLARPKLPL